jgi:hypothetical protein
MRDDASSAVDPTLFTFLFAAPQETINELGRLFEKVLADPDLKAALVTLVGQLCQDKEVFNSIGDLVVKLGAEERVNSVGRILCLRVCGTASAVVWDAFALALFLLITACALIHRSVYMGQDMCRCQ